jgi:hypothetical protein
MCAIKCHWIAKSSHSFLMAGSDDSRARCSLASALNRYVEDGSTMPGTVGASYSCGAEVTLPLDAKKVTLALWLIP